MSPTGQDCFAARRPRAEFSATHWSLVLRVGQSDLAGAAAALERLCRTYWYPIYAFIRRRGASPPAAEDLTQAFFEFLLENETLKQVDRQKGKFRNFLLAALNNFLANEWDRRQTLKRGGRRPLHSLDELVAGGLYLHEPVELLTPEKLFERQWALVLLQQVFARLHQEYRASGKGALFAKLEPALTGEVATGELAGWAAELGMSAGAVNVALHRMRRHFGKLLRSEIAHTVSGPEEIDEEIRHLFAAIALSP